ncbi:hypothetical protein [Herminiimonas contaminans]|uniref:Holin (3TMs family) n=1 Tax=Herminiimonas contaminans TaxID=1111140 RepID=A0ABS0ER55_9BURK|nr:hypothetical protein [Herminiimonas contaminans]MBF8177259.1 hypothetical protein [Herminiimonas contaminans]
MDPLTIALSLAAQFAPGIIKYLTGSDTAGTVAGQVVDIAKTVTGKTDPEEVIKALQVDPGLVLQFQTAVLNSEADLEKAYLADRESARSRDVELAKLGRKNVRADIMVALDVIGLIACLVVLCLFRDAIPGETVGLISTIASIFGLCLRDAHQFEFGSSRSSLSKDDTIKNLTK